MKKVYALLTLITFATLYSPATLWAQTTVYNNTFTGTGGAAITPGTPAATFTSFIPVATGEANGVQIGGSDVFWPTAPGLPFTNNQLSVWVDANSGVVAVNEAVYTTAPLTAYSAPFSPTLSSNPTIVTWTMNMRTRVNTTGFGANDDNAIVVLAATSATLSTAGNGYAVAFDPADPNAVELVRYTGGIRGTVTTLKSSTAILDLANGNDYASVKVTYTVATNTWTLSLRDDGAGGFADPATGTLTTIGSVVDATYTGVAMSVFGFYGNYHLGALSLKCNFAYFDNFTVTTGNCTTPTINGTMTVCKGATTTLTDATAGGTWSTTPGTGSVTDPGGVVTGVTAGTANVTYTSSPGCFATAIVTVDPSPAAISGTGSVCSGSTVSLSDATGGGTWSSSNTAVGTVSATGVVAGIAASGSTTITYTLNPGNCFVILPVTVNPLPTAILGTLTVCQGASTTLTDGAAGGAWTTTPGTGSVTDPGGVVTGVGAGTATVIYSIGSCSITATVTVNASPTAILGTPNVCVGLTTLLTDAIAGGTWSSSASGIASVGTGSGLVTGAGAGGIATITYTMPGNCFITTPVTVNPAPSGINGTLIVCQGATTTLTDNVAGGAWSSSLPGIGSIGAGTGIAGGISGGTTVITYTSANCTPVTAVLTVNPVSPILGTLTVCSGLATSLTDAISGGTWVSGSTGVATIGSSSGLVTGMGAGGTSTIVYTFTTGCTTSAVVTVNPSPAAIVGTTTLCYGTTSTFTDPTGGGAWTSTNTAAATIASGTGVATGTAAAGGVTTIVYTLPAGCTATSILTVNPVPAPISGTLVVCVGLSTTLTDATAGGTWSSDNTPVAIIGSATGFATGMGTGNATVSYLLPTGCVATAIMTVNTSPAAIAGSHSLCVGVPTTLTDPTGAGTWSSSNTGVATIGSSSGTALGSTTGTSTITFTLATGGCTATTTITVNPLPAAIGGTLSGCAGFTTTLTDGTGGGTWSSSTPFVATIGSATGFVNALNTGNTTIDYTLNTGCIASAVFTVNPSPGAISGTPNICQGATATFTDTPPGGAWSSSTTNAVVGTSGVVSGNTPGPAIISYTLPTTCFSIYPVTINPAPDPISGPNQVCVASAITLADDISGGSWSVTPGSGTATISTTGVLTGGSAGVVLISYTTFNCSPATYPVTVNALPTAIMGVGNLCQGSSTTLTDATPGGTWSSSDALVGISSTGVVTGVGTGAGTNISYTLPTGCYVTVPVVVFPVPDSIKGTDSVCQGSSVILSDLTPGGVWSSSDGTVALSIAFTGEIDGVVAGNVHISYTLVSGCYMTVPFKVISPLPASLTISQSPDTLLCANTPVTLTANPVNGGTPTFVWELFGSYVGSGPSYPYDPTHGDYITCVMTTHNICASPAIVDASITLNVYPLVTPIVTISTLTNSDTVGYLGGVYTFFSDVTYGGTDPVYQWYENSAPIPGATNSSYTTNVYDNNDTIYCTVGINSPCDTGSLTGKSNTYIIYGLGFLSASSLSVTGNDLTLFPNPNTGSFTLGGTVNTTANSDVTIEVVDMLGRTVYTGKTTPHNGAIHAEIKLANDIAAGSYLLRVSAATGNETFHFAIGK